MSTVLSAPVAWAWETEVEIDAADLPAISPELVLVSPDLRRRALALLPDRSPDGWVPPPYVAPTPVPLVLVAPAVAAPQEEPSLLLSASLYALESVAHAAIMGGVLIAVTAVLALLADVAPL